MTEAQKAAARSRTERIGAEKEQRARRRLCSETAANREVVPLHMSAFAEELAKHLPNDAIIFDEALTYTAELTR